MAGAVVGRRQGDWRLLEIAVEDMVWDQLHACGGQGDLEGFTSALLQFGCRFTPQACWALIVDCFWGEGRWDPSLLEIVLSRPAAAELMPDLEGTKEYEKIQFVLGQLLLEGIWKNQVVVVQSIVRFALSFEEKKLGNPLDAHPGMFLTLKEFSEAYDYLLRHEAPPVLRLERFLSQTRRVTILSEIGGKRGGISREQKGRLPLTNVRV